MTVEWAMPASSERPRRRKEMRLVDYYILCGEIFVLFCFCMVLVFEFVCMCKGK